ncbi:MAG: hypothetical protein KGM96_08730 [Acidobacteriota bacterium]|nr:hypothetical protein [Acidobacteriota bacterium]
MKNCTGMDTKLADLLLNPDAAPAKVVAHVVECDSCRGELEELRATMNLLDSWEAPEPSPFFMTRMNARLDEERAAPPAGWLERLRARFAYGPSLHARPLAAMALTVVVLLGGGAYLGISNWTQPAATQGQAAVVHDLQLLDNNAQLLDQLESISGNEN